jgi:hypothetical protein
MRFWPCSLGRHDGPGSPDGRIRLFFKRLCHAKAGYIHLATLHGLHVSDLSSLERHSSYWRLLFRTFSFYIRELESRSSERSRAFATSLQPLSQKSRMAAPDAAAAKNRMNVHAHYIKATLESFSLHFSWIMHGPPPSPLNRNEWHWKHGHRLFQSTRLDRYYPILALVRFCKLSNHFRPRVMPVLHLTFADHQTSPPLSVPLDCSKLASHLCPSFSSLPPPLSTHG